mmetsp:Transcript_29412/g.70072  ORF Transcript_29412/g.70072 Transcript_29412/m.70072 type:complete len:256 (-) Transcript_29412:751-1518(-)
MASMAAASETLQPSTHSMVITRAAESSGTTRGAEQEPARPPRRRSARHRLRRAAWAASTVKSISSAMLLDRESTIQPSRTSGKIHAAAAARSLIVPMSCATATSSPGYWTLTATGCPPGRVALCTCAREAAARASGSKVSKSSQLWAPSSLRSTTSISDAERGGIASCRDSSSSRYSAGTIDIVDASCPAFTYMPPFAWRTCTRRVPRSSWSSANSSAYSSLLTRPFFAKASHLYSKAERTLQEIARAVWGSERR